MPPSILILTQLGDIHAYSVAEALRRKGVETFLWHTTDFPSRAEESVAFTNDQSEISILSPTLSLTPSIIGNLSAVWRRRPGIVLDEAVLHISDRKFAETECRIFRKSLLDFIAPHAFWVNAQSSAIDAGSKLTQHFLAKESGLTLPDTLYSNDPDKIRTFIRDHPGKTIYKPFRAAFWRGDTADWAPYTALVNEDDLVDDEVLRQTPGIFQALVPKAYELRVTMMGQMAFTAKILSQSTEAGKIDWRRSYSELSMEPYVLPPALRRACVRLMKRLRLVFACIDLIVTPSGDYVFLEINEMGQFLFIERYIELPLLDAFSDFLMHGSETFRWRKKQRPLTYSDVLPEAERLAAQAETYHIALPEDAAFKE
jgi:hypothetical protein